MAENRLNDETCSAIREGLTLPLGPSSAPFQLNTEEQSWQPADWAWFFLSRNRQYEDAYQEHASDDDLDLADVLDNSTQLKGLKPDRDGTCAARFGLAAWLPPSLLRLPKFSNISDSWFFPLLRPVAEDYRRKEVGPEHYARPWSIYRADLDTYPHILANETPFGYRSPPKAPVADGDPGSTWGIIWVAVDCSIPPDGQVSALLDLARAMRRKLRENGWLTHKRFVECSITDIARSDAFKHLLFTRGARATSKVSDVRSVWRAVQFDALGPVVRQRSLVLKRLKEVHQELVAQGLAKEVGFERFRSMLPAVQDGDGKFRHGGSYLKALATLAEMDGWGHDARTISRVIGIRGAGDRYDNAWKRHFDDNIERYIDEGRQVIDGGYRLLLHAQKPGIRLVGS